MDQNDLGCENNSTKGPSGSTMDTSYVNMSCCRQVSAINNVIPVFLQNNSPIISSPLQAPFNPQKELYSNDDCSKGI